MALKGRQQMMRYYIGDNQFITDQSRTSNDHILKTIGFSLHSVITTDLFYNDTVTFIDTYNGPNTDFILKTIQERKQQGLDSRLIFDYAYEAGVGYHEMDLYTKRLKDSEIESEKVTFVLNKAAVRLLDKPEFLNGYDQFFFIDYFAILNYYRILEGINTTAKKPIWERKPVLNILLGKLLYKKSRLKALQLLYGKGLAQDAVKGILITKEHLLEHQRGFESQQFFRWLLDNLGSADNVPITIDSKDNKTLHCTGSPYNPDIYNNSQVSYICETSCPEIEQGKYFLTEKTYRPILNKSPFVLQGDRESLPYLQSLGFDIYDKYTGDYYNENDYDKYIKNTVNASKKLLDSCSQFPEEINQIAEKNMSLLIDISKRELLKLREVLKANHAQVSYKWLS